MRIVPGWVVGALGVAVVGGAFLLGGRLAASDLSPNPVATVASAPAPGLQVECEPGQRAVVRQSGLVNPGPATVACVSTGLVGYLDAPTASQPYAAPAPRMVRTASVSAPSVRTVARAPVQRNRSTKKSVAIIAGSTAAGAIVGGVAKGKKGALIGGLIGGGAATIWDQVTRRKGN